MGTMNRGQALAQWITWKLVWSLYWRSNLFFMVVVIVGCVFFGALNTYASTRGYGWLFNWIPVSLDQIESALCGILMISTGWLAVVFTNHFADLGNLAWTSPDLLPAAGAMVYTILYEIPKEFFTTLFVNPTAVFETVLTKEIVLFVYTFGEAVGYCWSSLTDLTSGPLNEYLTRWGEIIGSWWSSAIGGLGWFIRTPFLYLVDTVYGLIAPTGTGVMATMTTPIFKGLATSISVGIIIWIMRFFGFPF
jgi:hypothetical protein